MLSAQQDLRSNGARSRRNKEETRKETWAGPKKEKEGEGRKGRKKRRQKKKRQRLPSLPDSLHNHTQNVKTRQLKTKPSPGPGRSASEGPCDPLANKMKQTPFPKKGAPIAPALKALSLDLARAWGWRDHLSLTSVRLSTRATRNVWLQTQQKGKNETTNKKHRNTLAASRPKRASEGRPQKGRASELKPRKFQENPKRTRGPEWHPREKRQEKGRTAKKGDKPTAAGQKGKNQNVQCGGVVLQPELYLLKKIK